MSMLGMYRYSTKRSDKLVALMSNSVQQLVYQGHIGVLRLFHQSSCTDKARLVVLEADIVKQICHRQEVTRTKQTSEAAHQNPRWLIKHNITQILLPPLYFTVKLWGLRDIPSCSRPGKYARVLILHGNMLCVYGCCYLHVKISMQHSKLMVHGLASD